MKLKIHHVRSSRAREKLFFVDMFDAAPENDGNGNGALVVYSVNTGIIATIIAFFVGVFG